METIVISIGGSVILSEEANVSFFKNLKNLLKRLSERYQIYIIVGGGRTSRDYIKLGRKLNFNETTLDEFGIDITRINAKFLANIVGISNKIIPTSTNEAIKINKQIVIMGGTTPGHSTDMVGAELADKVNADKYIIATNVDGIYNKDPNIYSDASKLKEISIDVLVKEHGTEWGQAGKNVVIDGPALKIIHQAKIPTFVLNGKRLDQLEKAINNQLFDGTIIKI